MMIRGMRSASDVQTMRLSRLASLFRKSDSGVNQPGGQNPPNWLLQFYLVAALSLFAATVTVFVSSKLRDYREAEARINELWSRWSDCNSRASQASLPVLAIPESKYFGQEPQPQADSLAHAIADFEQALIDLSTASAQAAASDQGLGFHQATSRIIRNGYDLINAARSAADVGKSSEAAQAKAAMAVLQQARVSYQAARIQYRADQVKAQRTQIRKITEKVESLQGFLLAVQAGIIALIAVIVLLSHRLYRRLRFTERQREQAHEELAESELRLRTLIGNIPGAVFRLRIAPNWPLEFISDEIEQLTGYPAAELIENRVRLSGSLIHPEDRPQAVAVLTAAVADQTNYIVEYRLLQRNGRTIWVQERGQVVCDAAGNAARIDGVLVDISARKADEAKLQAAAEDVAALLNAGPGPSLLIGSDRRIEAANQQLAELIGRPLDNIIGRSWAEISPLAPAWELQEQIRAAIAGATAIELRQSSAGRHYRIFVRPALQPGGPSGRVAISVLDVTEQQQLADQLAETSERYRELVNSQEEGICLSDLDGRFLVVNPAAERIFGVDPGALLNRRSDEFMDAAELARARRERDDGLKSGRTNYETWINQPSGERRWVSVSVAPRYDRDRRLIGHFGVFRDITNLRTTQAALHESELRFKEVFESISVGMLLADQTGRVIDCNPAICRMLGYLPDDLRHAEIADLIFASDFDRARSAMTPLANSRAQRPLELELRMRRKDGSIVWTETTAVAHDSSDGTPQYYIGLVQDITGRKQAEAELRASLLQLHTLVDSAAEGIIVTDADGIVRSLNPAAAQILDLTEPQTGFSVLRYLPELTRESLQRNDRRSFETRARTPAGRDFPIQMSLSRVAIGEEESLTIIMRDLTEEQARRQQLLEADKFASIGTLAAGVAHEFKNHLAGIIGHAGFALDNLGGPDGIQGAREAFEQIMLVGNKANETVMALLTYSGNQSDALAPVDLTEVVEASARFASKELADRHIKFRREFAPIPRTMASPGRMQQVVLNLMLNATQAMPHGGELTIGLGADDESIYLRVSDTGVGIPPENLTRIFDPFFSTKGVWGRDSGFGTGLGLSLCRNIVSAHSGSITVASAVDKGSTFTVRLPIAPAPLEGDNFTATITHLIIFSLDPHTLQAYANECRDLGLTFTRPETIRDLSPLATQRRAICLIDTFRLPESDLAIIARECRACNFPTVLINANQSIRPRDQMRDLTELVVDGAPALTMLLRHFAAEAAPAAAHPVRS